MIGRALLAGLALDAARPLNGSHDTLHGTRSQTAPHLSASPFSHSPNANS